MRNKTNLGVAESRNYGIEMATGKYILFVMRMICGTRKN
ncbi:glycosyl transferase domain protein [Escherichia coli DEC7D]|nr:glycosyl transferase domain protein [Escherichia coli DEC7D]